MNKWMLAPITLLLSGAAVLPALAQAPGSDGAARSAQGEYVRERAGEPGEERSDGAERGNRSNRAPNFADRGDARSNDDRRDSRSDFRQDDDDRGRYENRQDARYEARQDARQDFRQDARHEARQDLRYDSRYDQRQDTRYDSRYDTRYDSRHRDHDRSRYVRQDDRRWRGNYWYPQYRYRAPVRYVYPYGYRPYQWRVGHRLPASYYHRNYYIDYRAYRLPPPPYGYYWVRVDRDVVLVAAATGLIRDILYGLYY